VGKQLWWIGGFLLLHLNLYAQVDRGSLTGAVRDSSGLVVPGATVVASQNSTGLRRATITSRTGTYDLPELAVGTYTVAFGRQGFQTVKFERLEIAVEHTTTLNAVLQVSGAT